MATNELGTRRVRQSLAAAAAAGTSIMPATVGWNSGVVMWVSR